MNLTLVRECVCGQAVIGHLAEGDTFLCYTLERESMRIPGGTYKVGLRYSPHFDRTVPWLSVPGRTLIEIHPGNTFVDTHGCILVGKTRGDGWVGESKTAFIEFMAHLQLPADLTVEDVPDPPKSPSGEAIGATGEPAEKGGKQE